jgi:hypothetical protein
MTDQLCPRAEERCRLAFWRERPSHGLHRLNPLSRYWARSTDWGRHRHRNLQWTAARQGHLPVPTLWTGASVVASGCTAGPLDFQPGKLGDQARRCRRGMARWRLVEVGRADLERTGHQRSQQIMAGTPHAWPSCDRTARVQPARRVGSKGERRRQSQTPARAPATRNCPIASNQSG